MDDARLCCGCSVRGRQEGCCQSGPASSRIMLSVLSRMKDTINVCRPERPNSHATSGIERERTLRQPSWMTFARLSVNWRKTGVSPCASFRWVPGQTMKRIGFYLCTQFISHGQLYRSPSIHGVHASFVFCAFCACSGICVRQHVHSRSETFYLFLLWTHLVDAVDSSLRFVHPCPLLCAYVSTGSGTTRCTAGQL